MDRILKRARQTRARVWVAAGLCAASLAYLWYRSQHQQQQLQQHQSEQQSEPQQQQSERQQEQQYQVSSQGFCVVSLFMLQQVIR